MITSGSRSRRPWPAVSRPSRCWSATPRCRRPPGLPESLHPLAYRQAERVDPGADFHTHADRLCRKLPGTPRRAALYWVPAAAAVLALAALGGGIAFWPKGPPPAGVDPVPPPPAVAVHADRNTAPVIVAGRDIVHPPDPAVPKQVEGLRDSVERAAEEQKKRDEDRRRAEAEGRQRAEAEGRRQRADEERREKERKEETYREAVRKSEEGVEVVAGNDPQTLDLVEDTLRRFIPVAESGAIPRAVAAKTYLKLGCVLAAKRDHAGARAAWQTAKKLYAGTEEAHMVRRMQERLDTLPKE